METQDVPAAVNLLIVGSGPVGAAFARTVFDAVPNATVLMVDAGPQLTGRAGENIRNVPPPRSVTQSHPQDSDLAAPSSFVDETAPPESTHGGTDVTQQRHSVVPEMASAIVARPGTHLVRRHEPGASEQDGMPAAAMSTNVGGMSCHWTCACPRPSGSERIPFLPDAEMDRGFAVAEELLAVTREGFRETPEGVRVRTVLRRLYDHHRVPDRRVRLMPLACRPRYPEPPLWSGAATVLGRLAEPDTGDGRFVLRAETLCRRLLVDGSRISGAELEHLPSRTRFTVAVDVVVVAADAFRTPQLLWASGIRPRALGRYLNDQPMVVAAAYFDVPPAGDRAGGEGSITADALSVSGDQLTGVLWVPFDEPDHPFHGQVMQLDASPFFGGVSSRAPRRLILGLGWFTTKELREEDRIEFSDTEADAFGMPAMTIHYTLSESDRQAVRRAIGEVGRVAKALGDIVPNGEPRLLPAGSSLHYQGSVRMGMSNDDQSVCDTYSRVWETDNLFVGGNGVIPTATACNPTLTSVALAVRAAHRVTNLLT